METVKIPNFKSDTQVAALKETHKVTRVAVVEDEGKEYYALFKDPTFDHIKVFNDLNEKNDEIAAMKSLYNNCVLAHDDEISENDLYKMEVVKVIATRFTSMKGSIKNS
jgi:hypothetical protein